MKKTLAIILSIVLALAMSVTAFAADGNVSSNGGSQDIDVSAKYVDSTVTGTVYSVDISWGAMEFTYTKSGSKNWNPSSHTYDDNTSYGWSASGNEISVTNHSNTEIKASFAYSAIDGYTALTGSFSNAALTLPSADGKALNAAELTVKTALTLAGELGSSVTSVTKVGKVTVTISK